MGVTGIRLSGQDEVVSMIISDEGEYMLTVSEKGIGKLTSLKEFAVHHRGTKGMLCYRIAERTGNVIGAIGAETEDEIMMINTNGIIIRMSCRNISITGRSASGAAPPRWAAWSPAC